MVLTTAILDRILYRCEIIKLTGKSFRMQNRKTIFKKDKNLKIMMKLCILDCHFLCTPTYRKLCTFSF